jgi:predicted NUDIX family NTP pyrophosphohydrolase
MPKRSAGILLYRRSGGRMLEVLLVHPGGPFWAKKDAGAWSLPKGEYQPGEDPLDAARREFEEETGVRLEGPFVALGTFRQSAAKIVEAWGCESDFDPAELRSNVVRLEWPPRSGRMQEFPEVDRAQWFTLAEATDKIHKGQAPILSALERRLGAAHS